MKCSSEPPAMTERPQTGRQIQAALRRDVLASTARADAASKALITIMDDIPSGMPHPDGSQRIQNAALALAAARGEVMQAHSRLDEFLARGIDPNGLKPDRPA
ncbi:MAG: hypothetical protein ABI833_02955 [Acidobacteriota bacterium]